MTDRQKDTKTDRQTDKTERQTKQIDRQTDKQIHRQTNQIDRQTDRYTYRQTERQIHRKTDRHGGTNCFYHSAKTRKKRKAVFLKGCCVYCSIHLHHHLMGVLSIINFRPCDSPVLLEKGANESVCCVIYSGFATAVSNSCVSSPETMNLIEKLTADVIDFSFST